MTDQPPTANEEVEMRDALARLGIFAADNVLLHDEETYAAIRSRPSSVATRIIVTAAIGHLMGVGLIQPLPKDQWPEFISMETPDHLRPDIDAMLGRA